MQKRIPAGVATEYANPALEALIIDAAQKLIRSTNPRRVRRLLGLLAEQAHGCTNPAVTEYYRRVAQETLLEEGAKR